MKFTYLFLLSSLSLISSACFAEENHDRHNIQSAHAVEQLSPSLRQLLSKEMLAIQDGMMSIIPAYVSGDWPTISQIALKIKNSYILKQSLSNAQIHELHSTLPPSFLTLDQQFHYLAGMLSHAADTKKPELMGFYYSELTRTCVACHRQFAQHQFPALSDEPEPDNHH